MRFIIEQEALDQYLQGIIWTMHYLRCQCCDPNYYYPYASPNSSTVLATNEASRMVSVKVHSSPFSEMLFPLEFCVAILPPESKEHVPVEEVGRLLDPDYENGRQTIDCH